jgi:hypothetical protein
MRQALILLPILYLCLIPGCRQSVENPAIKATTSEQVIESHQADLDGDGVVETVSITAKTWKNGHPMGGAILVFQPGENGQQEVWRQENLNPWKLCIADVDGDGKREIVAGVWKKSPKDPVMAKRPFVYSWNGERMMPKWLGSRLSRRFDDFTLADINRDGWDEIVALEAASKGSHRVAVYRWRSFGFDWLGCSSDIADLKALRTEKNDVFAVKNTGNILKVHYKKDGIELISREDVGDEF